MKLFVEKIPYGSHFMYYLMAYFPQNSPYNNTHGLLIAYTMWFTKCHVNIANQYNNIK